MSNKARYFQHLYETAESDQEKAIYHRQMMKHRKRKREKRMKFKEMAESLANGVENHIKEEDRKLKKKENE